MRNYRKNAILMLNSKIPVKTTIFFFLKCFVFYKVFNIFSKCKAIAEAKSILNVQHGFTAFRAILVKISVV